MSEETSDIMKFKASSLEGVGEAFAAAVALSAVYDELRQRNCIFFNRRQGFQPLTGVWIVGGFKSSTGF